MYIARGKWAVLCVQVMPVWRWLAENSFVNKRPSKSRLNVLSNFFVSPVKERRPLSLSLSLLYRHMNLTIGTTGQWRSRLTERTPFFFLFLRHSITALLSIYPQKGDTTFFRMLSGIESSFPPHSPSPFFCNNKTSLETGRGVVIITDNDLHSFELTFSLC